MVTTEIVKTVEQLHNQTLELAQQLDALRESLAIAATAIAKPKGNRLNVAMLTADLKSQIKAELLAELKKSPKAPRPTPRQWSIEEKRRILHEAQASKTQWGGVQRVMNKYGITSAHLVQWRDQIKAAATRSQV